MDVASRRAVTGRTDLDGGTADGEHTMLAGVPPEPLALVVAGHRGAGRDALLGALLEVPPSVLRVPNGSYLVVGPDHDATGPAVVAEGEAYVPGHRRPYPYRPEPVGAGPALARPPRRVELTLSAALLRHTNCVDVGDPALLGVPGRRVVCDVAERGGALLFVLAAGEPPSPAGLELLSEVAQGEAVVFFVAVSAGDATGSEPGVEQSAVLAAVPALADAPWLWVDATAPDVGQLRRVLVDWATLEGLRRASLAGPAVPRAAAGRVPVAADAATSDWADRLDARVRSVEHRVRQGLALELAGIHLRCVEALLFGSGCPGLPDQLDQELHALSLRAVEACETGVREVLDDALSRVFGVPPESPPGPDVNGELRQRVSVAVGWGLARHRQGRDLDRVLLVGGDAAVHPVTGLGVVRSVSAYPHGWGGALLPPLGLALAGTSYQHWRNPAHADVGRARSWLQRALREVELELSREVLRRFAAVRDALAQVLGTAIAEGELRT